MSRYAKSSGTLHEVSGRYAKVGGVWRTVTTRYVKHNGVWSQVYSSGKKLSDLPVGSLLKIAENGVPQQYIVVNQGNPDTSIYDASCNGTWVLRKDILENHQWHTSDQNIYAVSAINSHLGGAVLSLFSTATQSAIKQIKIPYINGYGNSGGIANGANGLSVKIFLLSGYEVGLTTADNVYLPHEGKQLSYFLNGTGSDAALKRRASLNGSVSIWWLRSPLTNGTNYSWYIYGDLSSSYCSLSYGVRPAMILDPTALVSSSPDTDNCYTLQ